MKPPSRKTTTPRVAYMVTAAILVTASLASIGMIQTDAQRGGNIIFKQRITENFASAFATSVEGSILTQAFVETFTTVSGDSQILLIIAQVDTSTDTLLFNFFGSSPADEFTVANSLGSASFSGTVTGIDEVTGEELTFTVDGDLTATGKPERVNGGNRFNSPGLTIVENFNGHVRTASGSLDVSGDGISLSTDDATGHISRLRTGSIVVFRP
jgi:hypothetical protein